MLLIFVLQQPVIVVHARVTVGLSVNFVMPFATSVVAKVTFQQLAVQQLLVPMQ